MSESLAKRRFRISPSLAVAIGVTTLLALSSSGAFAHNAGPFAGLVTAITNFKDALLAVGVALISIGIIGACLAYFNRTQEGLGGVFYGALVVVFVGAVLFASDTIVAALPNSGGALV